MEDQPSRLGDHGRYLAKAMQILIDANAEDSRSEEMRLICEKHGLKFRPVKLFPQSVFPHDIVGAEDIPLDANVFLFGSPALMSHIQRHRRWTPGGWSTFENFSCDIYYSHFGRYLLNDCYTLLPAAEAIRQSTNLYHTFSIGGEIFARPSVGRKLFTGRTFECDEYLKTIGECPDPQSLIVISKPKLIQREWRFYIANNRICTYSQYACNGERELSKDVPIDAIEFVESVLKNTIWRPDPMFAMDVCVSDGQIKLLELNAFSCSNLYEGDLNAIIESVVSMAGQS